MADALEVLRGAFGADAGFRDGQAEAVAAVTAGERLLLVQSTGWGKSIVYFTATALLRSRGSGPTIVVSPLLSLMRDQQRAAARFGLACAHVDGKSDFAELAHTLAEARVDVVFTTPEQLVGRRFQGALAAAAAGPGLIVVDEAHCVSDWGHDFRPEYRRLARFLRSLDRRTPLLATTATANGRVCADAVEQLGDDLVVRRGPLVRESLRLAAFSLPDHASRLAWLASNVPRMDGAGIVYCLTIADCERVSAWLAANGIVAPAYHSQLDDEARVALEEALLRNEVKALVATVALGMGFDKPDLGFVVHYQLPASIVAYYQQVGRAGRAIPTAHAVLLSGAEDAEIHDYFISTAFPDPERMTAVVELLEAAGDGMTLDTVLGHLNVSRAKAKQILDLLVLDGHAERDGARYRRTSLAFAVDRERMAAVTERRRAEFEQVRALLTSRTCLMQAVTAALDDVVDAPCGRCAVCAASPFSAAVDDRTVLAALAFLRRAHVDVQPCKQFPATAAGGRKAIPADRRCEVGRALCYAGDPGVGALVREGRRAPDGYAAALVDAAVEMVRAWHPAVAPTWVTAVPAAAEPDRSSRLGEAIAAGLGLPFHATLARAAAAPPQREMLNASQRHANAAAAYALVARPPGGPVLLVDDLVDSRWTFAVCGALLRGAGCAAVLPMALARATPGDA